MIDAHALRASAAAGSTRYPYAAWMPLTEGATQARITPTTLVLHSMAGPSLTTLDALWKYCNRDDVEIEPTFALDMDGRMAQYVEADRRADCNFRANAFAGSVETQDRGSAALATTPWTDAQLEQLAGLAAWYHLRFGVRLEQPVAWNGGGVGEHRRFPEWSVYVGKSCPGDARVSQIPLILDRARRLVAPVSLPPPVMPDPVSEDDMAVVGYFRGIPGLVFASATSWRWAKDPADIDSMVFMGLARYGPGGQPVELDPAWYKAPETK